jgi:hypothetical protein
MGNGFPFPPASEALPLVVPRVSTMITAYVTAYAQLSIATGTARLATAAIIKSDRDDTTCPYGDAYVND